MTKQYNKDENSPVKSIAEKEEKYYKSFVGNFNEILLAAIFGEDKQFNDQFKLYSVYPICENNNENNDDWWVFELDQRCQKYIKFCFEPRKSRDSGKPKINCLRILNSMKSLLIAVFFLKNKRYTEAEDILLKMYLYPFVDALDLKNLSAEKRDSKVSYSSFYEETSYSLFNITDFAYKELLSQNNDLKNFLLRWYTFDEKDNEENLVLALKLYLIQQGYGEKLLESVKKSCNKIINSKRNDNFTNYLIDFLRKNPNLSLNLGSKVKISKTERILKLVINLLVVVLLLSIVVLIFYKKNISTKKLTSKYILIKKKNPKIYRRKSV